MHRRLHRLWWRLQRTWRAAQVELRGEYSVGRLLRLRDYCEHTSTTRSLLVLVATPLPCLLVAVLIEAVPLRPPSDGLEYSLMLWLRSFLVAFESAFVVLQQCRWLVPRVPTSNAHIFAAATVVGLGATAATYGIARGVGFPLPFTLLCGPPFATSLLVTSVLAMWGHFLAQNRAERHTLVSYFGVVGVQISMIYVYPAYAYFFNQLSAGKQIGAMALLPVMKLLMKNIIAHIFRNQADLKPDAVVLNVEIYHALFLSWCMNGSTSKSAVASFLLIDVLEGALALFEVRHQLDLLAACRDTTKGADRSGSLPLLDETAAIAIELGGLPLEQRTTARVSSSLSIRHVTRATKTHRHLWPRLKLANIVPTGTARVGSAPVQAAKAVPTRGLSSSVIVLPLTADAIASDQLRRPSVPVDDACRRKFLHHALRLLHMTEFVLLVEFTEVMIPTIYNLYLLAAYHLPNRAFLTNIRDLSLDELSRNMLALLGYSLLEIASLLVLGLILQRQTRVSALQQLAFVLESQWQLAQAKLLLWVVFAVQTPLEHYGTDFSFRFAWLRR